MQIPGDEHLCEGVPGEGARFVEVLFDDIGVLVDNDLEISVVHVVICDGVELETSDQLGIDGLVGPFSEIDFQRGVFCFRPQDDLVLINVAHEIIAVFLVVYEPVTECDYGIVDRTVGLGLVVRGPVVHFVLIRYLGDIDLDVHVGVGNSRNECC